MRYLILYLDTWKTDPGYYYFYTDTEQQPLLIASEGILDVQLLFKSHHLDNKLQILKHTQPGSLA